MMFKEGTQLYSYEVIRESGENVIYINYLGASFVPSVSEYPEVMSRTIDILAENSDVSRIVFVQQRNYSINFEQTRMLLEIASMHGFLIKQEKILSQEKLYFARENFPEVYNFLNYIFNEIFKRDPITAYRQIKAEYFRQKSIVEENNGNEEYAKFLSRILVFLEKTELIRVAKDSIEHFPIGSREIYSTIFRADVMPNFTFTRMIAQIPEDAEIIKQYSIAKGYDKSNVTILRYPNSGKLIYHVIPPEYDLDEEHHMLLNLARNVLVEHRPSSQEFSDFERTRQVFFNVARDLIQDLAESKSLTINFENLNKLATILVRHTIGFGIIEVLLQDEDLQDIMINSPVSLSPIFVRHNDFDECTSNIVPSQEDAESWAAKFRMLSGRALDEANPILDTSLNLNEIRARVAIIQNPLSPGGLAYTLRRHRNNPWTLPLFMKNKMLDGLSAGLLSFMIDGARTFLIAGTRSSGKTSLLGSLMLEIMSKYRMIVVEDTLELPVDSIRNLGYDILSMKVRSALVGESVEVPANEGIRASLRLGDSGLIVGEIRSEEAKALYEAMRVGALANVVAGTIHGASPYAIFDRVVNDLGVPVTSFKATDCIVVANPVRTPDGLHSWKRVLQISEVRKHWTHDPLEEGGFVDLMKYDVKQDKLIPSDDLINGESEAVKSIAGNVKGWAGNWDAVWDNITLRQKIKEETIKMAEKTGTKELLEANFTVLSNNAFHQISDKVNVELGLPLSEKVFPEWKLWLEKEIRRIKK